MYHRHRKNLKMFEQRAYQFKCLSFRPYSAPWVFTKTLKCTLAFFKKGVRLIAYIRSWNKWLSINSNRNSTPFKNLGFTTHQTNPPQPLPLTDHTIPVNSLAMELQLPLAKWSKIWVVVLQAKATSACTLAHLQGMMNATNSVIPPGPYSVTSYKWHLGEELPMLQSTNHSNPVVSGRIRMMEQHEQME